MYLQFNFTDLLAKSINSIKHFILWRYVVDWLPSKGTYPCLNEQ